MSMPVQDVRQALISAVYDALGTISLSDLIVPPHARDIGGWFRCAWDAEDGSWTVQGPWKAPGTAFVPPDNEVWIYLGLDADSNVVAAIDEDDGLMLSAALYVDPHTIDQAIDHARGRFFKR